MQAALEGKRRPHRGHLHRLLFDDAAATEAGAGPPPAEEYSEADVLWGSLPSPDPMQNPSPARAAASSLMKPKRRSPAGRSSAAVPASMPVQIPDWSKILGAGAPVDRRNEADEWGWGSVVAGGEQYSYGGGAVVEDDDDDDDEEDASGVVIPPHEYLWRRRRGASAAAAGGAAFSLCEGIGRTLKGRDLSRVRNSVWEKIGFQD